LRCRKPPAMGAGTGSNRVWDTNGNSLKKKLNFRETASQPGGFQGKHGTGGHATDSRGVFERSAGGRPPDGGGDT